MDAKNNKKGGLQNYNVVLWTSLVSMHNILLIMNIIQ